MPVTTPFSFFTVQSRTEGLYKEKGSKFLSFAIPVLSEAEIKGHLKALRKEYFDARHHCYAYRLGADLAKTRAADDGEPNHSAGDPILGQIRSRNLTDIIIVVVRYFGGVKLGVGGLTQAYKAAAEDALRKAVIIEKDVVEQFDLVYDYVATPEVMKLIKEFEASISAQNFTDNCKLSLIVKRKFRDLWLEKIKLLNAMGTHIDMN